MRFFPKDQDLEGIIKKAEDFDQICMMNLMSLKPKTCYYHFLDSSHMIEEFMEEQKTTFCVLPCSPCVVSFPKFLEQSNSEAMISAWLFDVGKRTSATCHVFTVFLPQIKDGRYKSIDSRHFKGLKSQGFCATSPVLIDYHSFHVHPLKHQELI